MNTTKAIRGIAASPGIAIGPIVRYEAQKSVVQQQEASDVQCEVHHLDEALVQARKEVHQLYEQASL